MPTRDDVKAGRVPPRALDHTEPVVVVPPGLQINQHCYTDHRDRLLAFSRPPLTDDEIQRLYGITPDARGGRYPLELNSTERSLLPVDLQQIYGWEVAPAKWIMRAEYRAEFAKEFAD